ncbi:MAG TPA: hypothetical protein VNT79_16615 [Phycisphaerae bacterium]|nr:hypothetical protein [Phycisphaerae bacterium]
MADAAAAADKVKANDPAGGSPAKKPKSYATIGMVGGLMLIEGVGIFFAMKFFGAEPDPTVGMEHLEVTTQPFGDSKEIEVARVRVQNANGAKPMLYSVTIGIKVPADKESTISEDFLKNRKATVTDVISRIIRSADGAHLGEPGLETLKRKIHFELGELLGEKEVIEEVLIPEFTPVPMGF